MPWSCEVIAAMGTRRIRRDAELVLMAPILLNKLGCKQLAPLVLVLYSLSLRIDTQLQQEAIHKYHFQQEISSN